MSLIIKLLLKLAEKQRTSPVKYTNGKLNTRFTYFYLYLNGHLH